jgi:hypothetical protein
MTQPKIQSKRKCSFCQREVKLTREHVFPDWLTSLFPQEVMVTNQFTGSKNQEWLTRIFQHKAKIVCADCNGGWMCQLEKDVKPILTKLIKVEKFTLNEVEQSAVAFWVQKTILMLNRGTPGSLQITQEVFDDLFKNKCASKRVLVTVGWRLDQGLEKKSPLASFQIMQVPSVTVASQLEGQFKQQMESGGFIWKATLSIGHAVFEAVGHNMQFSLDLTQHTQVFRIIRPYVQDIDWPLEWPIDAEGGLEVIRSRY